MDDFDVGQFLQGGIFHYKTQIESKGFDNITYTLAKSWVNKITYQHTIAFTPSRKVSDNIIVCANRGMSTDFTHSLNPIYM